MLSDSREKLLLNLMEPLHADVTSCRVSDSLVGGEMFTFQVAAVETWKWYVWVDSCSAGEESMLI